MVCHMRNITRVSVPMATFAPPVAEVSSFKLPLIPGIFTYSLQAFDISHFQLLPEPFDRAHDILSQSHLSLGRTLKETSKGMLKRIKSSKSLFSLMSKDKQKAVTWARSWLASSCFIKGLFFPSLRSPDVNHVIDLMIQDGISLANERHNGSGFFGLRMYSQLDKLIVEIDLNDLDGCNTLI